MQCRPFHRCRLETLPFAVKNVIHPRRNFSIARTFGADTELLGSGVCKVIVRRFGFGFGLFGNGVGLAERLDPGVLQ